MRTALGLLIIALGCGSTTGKPLHAFPSRQDLATIANQQRATGPLGLDIAPIATFTLELPERTGPHPGHALLPKLLPQAKATAAMDCVAHEVARVIATAEDKRPGMSVRRFIAARCGALVLLPAYNVWAGEAPPNESDQTIVERLTQQLSDPIDAAATQAGAGLWRDGNKISFVIAHGTPEVEVRTFDQVVGDGSALQIRGRVLSEVDGLQAYVNTGDYGATPCVFDPAVAPPEFALRCELAQGDEAAWVQLMAVPRGRVLAHEVFGVIALRSQSAATRYAALRVGDARPVTDTSGFATAVLDMVNAVRNRAGLVALRAAAQQSRVANSVSPTFFAAMLSEHGEAGATLDAITLGLLAGWDVRGGIIRNGDLTASVIVDALDAERWLADALERPMGRAVLLDPDARVLALGSLLQPEPSLLAALAVTYAFFEDERTPGARAIKVLERLGRVRQARGLGATTLVRDAPGIAKQVARVHRGEVAPGKALDEAMHQISAEFGVPVQGFVWETHDLDTIEFPRELLQRGDLTLAAGVTYYRAPGGAWGQYVVLFVVINSARKV
jgi:hypothetical protein